MSAVKELEKAAIYYANEAIKFDRQGARARAITMYQKAIDALLKIVNLYPSYELNKIYLQRIELYRRRIRQLQEERGFVGGYEEEGGAPSGETITEGVKEKYSFDDLVLKEKPTVKWEDVAGLEEAKQAIREAIVYPTQRPDLFPLGWPRGILLFGPPGCGKTLLAAAVASEIKAHFYSVDAASIMSKWLGEAEKNVARLFKIAREKARKGEPVIIFIDELDSLLGVYSSEVGGEVRVRNQFLKEMDGLFDKSAKWFIYVIGATNKPWALDWAFIRRFQRRIFVPLPDFQTRLAMFKMYTKHLKLADDVDLEKLGEMTEGFTGSDIRDICQSAQLCVVRELFESGKALDKNAQPRPITMEDFMNVIKKRKPSVTPEMVRAYIIWNEKFRAS